MRAPNLSVITFAAALGLALAMPAAWAHPKNQNQPSPADIGKNSPITGIYETPGGCCWGGAILKYNEPIKLTFDRPMRIPGRVLPAGSYWFVMQDTATANTAAILDANQNVIATLEVGVTETPQDWPNNPVVKIAEGGPGEPDAIVSWSYPGFESGHEFYYPKDERRVIDEEPTQTVHVQWGGNYAKNG